MFKNYGIDDFTGVPVSIIVRDFMSVVTYVSVPSFKKSFSRAKLSSSVPDPGRSVFKSAPGSRSVFYIRIRIHQVKFSYKNLPFVQIFHDFRLI